MRFSIVFVLLVLLSINSKALCAEVLLTIKPQSHYFDPNTTLKFDLRPSLPKNSFRIRPLVTHGVCYVYSSEDVYISCSDRWTNLPVINSSLHIKLSATTSYVYLAFQIQNISTGKIVETNKVLLIKKSLVENYLNKVNANITSVGLKCSYKC